MNTRNKSLILFFAGLFVISGNAFAKKEAIEKYIKGIKLYSGTMVGTEVAKLGLRSYLYLQLPKETDPKKLETLATLAAAGDLATILLKLGVGGLPYIFTLLPNFLDFFHSIQIKKKAEFIALGNKNSKHNESDTMLQLILAAEKGSYITNQALILMNLKERRKMVRDLSDGDLMSAWNRKTGGSPMLSLLSLILWITRHVYEKKMVEKLASRPAV